MRISTEQLLNYSFLLLFQSVSIFANRPLRLTLLKLILFQKIMLTVLEPLEHPVLLHLLHTLRYSFEVYIALNNYRLTFSTPFMQCL